MKQFFGAFFGSIVGLLIAALIVALLVVAVVKASISAAMKSGGPATEQADGTGIMRIRFEGELVERQRDNPFEELGNVAPLVDVESFGLNTLLKKIRSAAKDDKIKGIYLRFGDMRAGMASLREIRKALKDFRKSGKFIYAYDEDISQAEYYIASVSDKVFLHPEGTLMWKGLGMNLLFFKNAFEKLGVEMQVFRHGKFKSAIEPFILDRMSEANREQSELFLHTMWNTMLEEISASRKLSVAELNRMADGLEIKFPEDAVGNLVDQVAYEDEVYDELRKRTGIKDKDKAPFFEIGSYSAKIEGKAGAGRIAVIYANGQITSGDGSDDEAGSERLSRAIREARTDDKVKAIVLRVNSPGGSALASDVIWREMQLAKKTKPTVVSMGDVAASGGYYIACGADRIFAQPNTITGSIGVFGVIPNIRRTLEQKLGINVDTVNTNKHGDFISVVRPVTEKEHQVLQGWVERVYETFTSRVAEGRNIPQSQVDSIGQGRVWSGADAKKLGLVDEFGGLQQAVAFAAKKAGISEYRITELPRLKGPFDGLFNNTEKEVSERIISRTLGGVTPYWQHLKNILSLKGVQARLPYDIVVY